MSSLVATAGSRTLGRVLPPWWLVLITGTAWTVVALIRGVRDIVLAFRLREVQHA